MCKCQEVKYKQLLKVVHHLHASGKNKKMYVWSMEIQIVQFCNFAYESNVLITVYKIGIAQINSKIHASSLTFKFS